MKLSRKTIIILLFILLGAGIFAVYNNANRIFPIDSEEVFLISVVQEQDVGPWPEYQLKDENRSRFIQSVNQLKPVKTENIGHIINTNRLNQKLYSVRVIYEYEKSRLRKNSVAWLYFYKDGKIITDCGGYTEYQVSNPYYKDVLVFLEEMESLCEE